MGAVGDRLKARRPGVPPESTAARTTQPPAHPTQQDLLQNRIEIPMLILSSDRTTKLAQHMERINQLPRGRQRFVIEMLDVLLAQARRSRDAP
jgi:hypothetical protein